MKYEDMNIDENNKELDSLHVLKSSESKSCMSCGNQTQYVDIFSEGHICSTECMDAWYKYYDDVVSGMIEAENSSEECTLCQHNIDNCVCRSIGYR